MNANEEVHRLKSELEHQQSDLREHSAQINQKIQETRAQLTDTYLFCHRVLLLSGVAFALGFALGYRGVSVDELRVEELGKPVARTILTTAGKQTARRVISGNQG